jgi:glycosyltransferase involved in cell wall biosynthesis
MMPRFLRAADAVIAVSEHTKADAIRTYGMREEKISVIYEGVADRFRRTSPDATAAVRRKYSLPDRFILSVGTIEPRKNLSALLEAYHVLRNEYPEYRLVLVGKKGWLYADFFRRIDELGLGDKIVFPGFVPDEDLPAMYSAADLFVFPSLYEGFGLPVLEALACGAAVVASNASSVPEVAGDAALLVDPNDGEALVREMRAVLNNAKLRQDLQARGPKQAAKFSWRKAAEETLDVYSAVLSD